MQIETFVSIGAKQRAGIVVALRHSPSVHKVNARTLIWMERIISVTEDGEKKANIQVVLMQKLALVSLFTQPPQPMLAH